MPTTETIKAHITMSNNGENLTMRLFLTDEQREKFVLERGTVPNTIFQIVVV